MSVKYSIAQMKNPLRPDETGKYYAKVQTREEVDLNRIAEELSYSTTLTDGDILNVLRGLIRKIKEHLADGDMVSLGEFGKFQYQLSSEGSESYEAFTYANIKKVRIQFRPGTMIRESLPNLHFEQVISVKARKEAKRKEAQKAVQEG